MNKSAQFTPGPWVVEYDVDGIPLTIIGSDSSAIGTIETWNDHTEGNRHVITAAPAMYEALQALLALIGDEDLPDNGELSGASICDFARSALAQAEGREG